MTTWVLGLIILGFLIVFSLLSYTKQLPFSDRGYELHATFENAATLSKSAPVRIAGVNVGEVSSVEPAGDAARVTFTVDDAGRPIHEDAVATIRPRLFLEGNFFIDLRPGSPSAPELPDGAAIPITRTATAVQLDEVLTALQSDSRADLQQLLEGYGTALTTSRRPPTTPTRTPTSRARALPSRSTTPSSTAARRARTQRSSTRPCWAASRTTSRADRPSATCSPSSRASEEQLKGLITNFNITTGALASESDEPLGLAPRAGADAGASPSPRCGTPAMRCRRCATSRARWSRACASCPARFSASGPWLDQMKLLLRHRELGGLARLLANAAPPLAKTSHEASQPAARADQAHRAASPTCSSPPATSSINDAFTSGESNFHEFFYGAVNARRHRGQLRRQRPVPARQRRRRARAGRCAEPGRRRLPGNTKVYGNTIEAPRGVQPACPSSPPPFRTDVPCKQQPACPTSTARRHVAPPDLTPAP